MNKKRSTCVWTMDRRILQLSCDVSEETKTSFSQSDQKNCCSQNAIPTTCLVFFKTEHHTDDENERDVACGRSQKVRKWKLARWGVGWLRWPPRRRDLGREGKGKGREMAENAYCFWGGKEGFWVIVDDFWWFLVWFWRYFDNFWSEVPRFLKSREKPCQHNERTPRNKTHWDNHMSWWWEMRNHR